MSAEPAVIAISGPIGAGKTSLALALAERLRWPRSSYGDLVRNVATSRGLTHNRTHLQQIGGELIGAGWDAFTHLVLGQAAWTPGKPLILDGLRHLDGAAVLRETVAPLPTIVVYLDLPARLGQQRADHRDGMTAIPGRADGEHPIELDLPHVRSWADLTLGSASARPDELAEKVIAHLPRRRCA